MLAGISGANPYSSYYMSLYRSAAPRGVTPGQNLTSPAEQSQNAQNAQRASGTLTAHRPSDLETPVQPVDAAKAVNPDAKAAGIDLPISWSIRQGADPAEMAVRMRIKPYEEDPDPLEDMPGAIDEETEEAQGAEGAQEALEEGECETCEKRKYQDGSDDMSVSYQAPTNIKPEQVASAVRGHEMEHVVHEQAKAKQEGRKVVSQTVTLHTDICPECGKVFISGGETRTTTKSVQEQPAPQEEQDKDKEEEKSFPTAA